MPDIRVQFRLRVSFEEFTEICGKERHALGWGVLWRRFSYQIIQDAFTGCCHKKCKNKATTLNSRRNTEFLSWGSHSGNAGASNVVFVRNDSHQVENVRSQAPWALTCESIYLTGVG